ncbi:kinesin-like protein KIF14 [Penaeus chinensis]|uniref:kinesin-like protein KIF14 n=1 Tax=Penaeus chinensis TaxID=139456 RepID=UPI001FB7E999|nr:kinesin-like protein KIF14 [Penaeus chinensis]XP_047494564.1 kinesin-like protein KIF14 [Penaeus chinensis]
MSKSKTEIEVVISSQFEGNSLVVKHDIKGRTKNTMRSQPSSKAVETEKATASVSSHVSGTTPRSTVRRTDLKATTPKTQSAASSSQAATPRTPSAAAIFNSTPRTPAISVTHPSDVATPTSVASSRNNTPGVSRTPLLPSGSKTPMANTPRHGVPLPKRFRRDDEHGRPTTGPRTGVQRSRSIRDAESRKKEDDGKQKENFPRVLSSSSINVPSPRISGNRLSAESKTPTSTKSSSARSSKASIGSNTPTVGSGRRSRASLNRYTSLLSEPPHTPMSQGSSGDFLTPDIVSRRSSVMPTSPGMEDNFDGTESTAVSVGVRVRPLNSRERVSDVKNIVEVAGNSIKLSSENGSVHSFAYDHCFWSCDEMHPMYTSQQSVYTTLARPLLDKSYEGYNVCLFAYGQTGSGKSYTMLGEESHEDPESDAGEALGVIPRFCRELFSRADYLHSQNPPEEQLPQCRIEVEVSYIEIYNERIYDLLSSGGCSGDRREALRVREHPEDGPYVEGVARHLVSSYNHLQTWLLLGNKERSIAATGMNEKSSRSHAVFTLRLKQMQVEDVEGERLESSRVSIINLVDLAGSERVAAAQSQGDRLKEGVCINKSLLTLGKVITALAESAGRRRPFIPYRESVLTYLLKESLGGNSRTAMLATISPSNIHVEETLSTLRYAQQARKIVNRNHINEDPTARIIRSLKEEVERLRRQQLVKSPTLLFEGEVTNESDKGEDLEDEKERERELALLEVEKEKDRAIKEKEEIISTLKEQLQLQYQLQQQQLTEKTRNFEQRLRENEERQQEALENQRLMGIASQEEKGPKLVNLCADPQMSETLSYRLKEGTTNIGHSHCDLILQGLHSSNVHCSIFNEEGHLTLFPKTDADTYINGVLITAPSALHHNDRLVLAGTYYFRVSIPGDSTDSSKEDSRKLDFYFTDQELLKEQERRLREEAEAALAASKAELERQMCHQRDQLMQEVHEAQNQLMNKQQLVVEMEGTQWKLEEEKRLLEEQILRDRKISQSLDVSLQSPPFLSSNFLQEVEAIFNESIQEVRREHTNTQPNLSFRVKEANQICKRLKKKYEFMIQEVLNETGLEVVVLVKDLNHHMTASLSPKAFMHKLQVLRDMVQGEEGEDVSLEMGMAWERTEDVNCVPAFINKLRDSSALAALNSSLNCSINASFAQQRRPNRRRSSILCSDRGSIFGSGGGGSASSGSVAVAGAIHRSLMSLPSYDPTSPAVDAAFSAVTDLYSNIQRIRDHITEPGMTLPDDEFSEYLVKLLCVSQGAKSSLLTVAAINPTTNCNRCSQLQEKIRKGSTRIASSTSRLFQGVKSEVESLVEEESRTLLSVSKDMAKDIAQLALTASLPTPNVSNLNIEGVVCKKFVEGLRSGLEWLVKHSADTANHITEFSDIATMSNSSKDTHSAEMHKAASAVSAFLKKFGHLDAAFDLSNTVTKEEQRSRLSEWVTRVELAADTINELNTALEEILGQVKIHTQSDIDKLEGAVEEVKTRLEKLMCFAGLGPKNSGTLNNCSFSSTSSLEDSGMFMDSLSTIAWRAVQAIESLQAVISQRDSISHPDSSNKHKASMILGHWPTNSKEYMEYRKGQRSTQKSPYKSSLRSATSVSGEEKRVRFNVSVSPPSTEVEDSLDV